MLDVAQPSEDEFELVMGLFEKATLEKTEFLHHVRLFSLHPNHAKLTSSRGASSKAPYSPHLSTIKRHSPAG
jgi:hypothetical protein